MREPSTNDIDWMTYEYLEKFATSIEVSLWWWGKSHEAGSPDTLGDFTPERVLAQAHHVGLVAAQKWADAKLDRGQFERFDFVGMDRWKLKVYANAVSRYAPVEWRAEFLSKPPPVWEG